VRTPFHVRYAPNTASGNPPPPSPEQSKFQDLLRELFQFDCADLDFGIYRIMNHKREVLDRYIDRELPAAIENAVTQGSTAREDERARTFKDIRKQVLENFGEDAIAPNGELVEFGDTPLGKKYDLWRRRTRHSEPTGNVRRDIYNHLYSFFSRYYQDGDFVPKRRYSREHPYVVPYNGEEVYFHWANRDQYYVKSAEHFSDYRFRAGSDVSVRFFLRTADVEQNDVKGETRFFFPLLAESAWNEEHRHLEMPFEYRPLTPSERRKLGRNNQQDSILAQREASIPDELASLPEAAMALLDRPQKRGGEVRRVNARTPPPGSRITPDDLLAKEHLTSLSTGISKAS